MTKLSLSKSIGDAPTLEELNAPELLLSVLDLTPKDDTDTLEACAVDLSTPPAPLDYLLQYTDGVGEPANLLARGTLLMVTGQSGCRKSTFIRHLVRVLLNGKADNYTLTAKREGLKVAYVDTEQHPARNYATGKHLRNLYTGAEPFADRFAIYSAVGLPNERIRSLLVTICERMRPDVLVLDVCSHLVEDINDQRASKEMVDLLNQIMKKYNVAIVGAIHQNPSTQSTAADKMAGAVGTKLLQATECVLHIELAKRNSKIYEWTESANAIEGEGLTSTNEKAYKRGSIVTIAKYRDKWPDIETLYICNDERNGLLTTARPCRVTEVKHKDGRNTITDICLQPVPAELVANKYNMFDQTTQTTLQL